MFDRILIPLDGSELAETALARTLPLAERLGAEVIVAQVLDPIPPVGLDAPYASPEVLEAALARQQESAEQYLKSVVDSIADVGVLGGWIVLEGDPALRLIEYARQESIDLIALTTHGRTGLARLTMGSVAERIVHDAPFPVLIHRALDRPPATGRGILVPLDGTREAERILPAAAVLAKALEEPLYLLRAVPVPANPRVGDGQAVQYVDEIVRDERAEAADYLRGVAEQLEADDLTVDRIVQVGKIIDVIIETAQRVDCRLIAMATHSLTGIARLVHSSVADQILRRTRVPVLLKRMTATMESTEARSARDIMTTELYTVAPDAPIEEALWLMVSKRVSGIPVVDDEQRLLGMVTEFDMLLGQAEVGQSEESGGLLRLAADLAGRPVKAFMTTAVEAVPETMPLDDVARLLLLKDVKRVPVVQDGRLVGIVSRSDLMRALATKLGVVQPVG